jgi:hypothetical protein
MKYLRILLPVFCMVTLFSIPASADLYPGSWTVSTEWNEIVYGKWDPQPFHKVSLPSFAWLRTSSLFRRESVPGSQKLNVPVLSKNGLFLAYRELQRAPGLHPDSHADVSNSPPWNTLICASRSDSQFFTCNFAFKMHNCRTGGVIWPRGISRDPWRRSSSGPHPSSQRLS